MGKEFKLHTMDEKARWPIDTECSTSSSHLGASRENQWQVPVCPPDRQELNQAASGEGVKCSV